MPSIEGVRIGEAAWPAELVRPPEAQGVVLFVHGPGETRCRCDRVVSAVFNEQRLATLHLESEPAPRLPRALPERLARRMVQALEWLGGDAELGALPCGTYGAGAGALLALAGAAARPGRIQAVVTHGARAELAAARPQRVVAPTLLLVGDGDRAQLDRHRHVLELLGGVKRLEVVPSGDRGRAEPGALVGLANLAAWWFDTHLGRPHHA